MIVNLVSAAEHQHDPNRIAAVVDVIDDDGNTRRLLHLFPKDTMEWRAAEYDLDPETDEDLLLDIVLYEPHIDIPDEHRLYRTDRENAKSHLVTAIKITKKKVQAERAKVRAAAGVSNVAAILAQEDAARSEIKRLSVMDKEAVQLKRERSNAIDAARQVRRAGLRPDVGDRVSALRRMKEFSERNK